MDQNILSYASTEITQALFDYSGGTKGQQQAFNENPPADKARNPRKSIHVIEFEDGRRVMAENAALYIKETRSRRRPLPPIRKMNLRLHSGAVQ
ncbi:hypothetical protein QQF54_20515 [Lelliottia sp. V106_10]|uniref:hypothetical protein n=1 Tax=Lelliottia wanjuensis TaxID=3050585 RepID=UPI00254DFCEA|nr:MULTISPECIES: hypothetical protein [unclassified Lelliottia]MDK9356418.1 hypothetical protein [Lelliottia sp. V106_16]MDK9375727.1 hypothetical protein [Lelliottia sp. V106_10]MDK9602277.1 hypothetical protein [Lelliottia sp. V106_5]